jgi:putative toxin-antitoxin system antitoxin component (TIGR02293 family)
MTQTAQAPVLPTELKQLVRSDDVASNARLSEIVDEGISLRNSGVEPAFLELVVSSGIVPRKTMEDAIKRKKGHLTPGNSERVVRAIRLAEKAKAALGEQAADWMVRPNRNFAGKSPMQMAKTESGARAVEQFLMRLVHGFNA